jgi:hypothetical protein
VPVDWVTLLDDLRRWNDGTRRVQKEWARACFANAPKGGADASTDHGENDLEEGSASDAA